LRGWGHGETEPVFPGGAGARGADGVRARPGTRVAVGGDHLDRRAAETLRSWVRQAERDGGRRPGLTTDERARVKQLERENVELRRANEILRLASAYFAKAELDRRAK